MTTSLYQAALDGDTGSAAMLLNQGADVNARDEQGRTPLHYTTTNLCNRPDGWDRPARLTLAGLLLGWGADPNLKDRYGNTPLSLALKWQSYRAMALLLLSRGADPNCLKDAGISPLHAAAYHGDAVVVEHLLLYGADVNAKDGNGEIATQVARRRGFPEVVSILELWGETVSETAE